MTRLSVCRIRINAFKSQRIPSNNHLKGYSKWHTWADYYPYYFS